VGDLHINLSATALAGLGYEAFQTEVPIQERREKREERREKREERRENHFIELRPRIDSGPVE
jgi:hypothetical protein